MSDKNYVIRRYMCKHCGEQHKITLDKDLKEQYDQFPFTFTYLHGEKKELLTTLYIDANLNIRGVEVSEVTTDSDLFSSEYSQQIAAQLMEQIEMKDAEIERLTARVTELEKKLA